MDVMKITVYQSIIKFLVSYRAGQAIWWRLFTVVFEFRSQCDHQDTNTMNHVATHQFSLHQKKYHDKDYSFKASQLLTI